MNSAVPELIRLNLKIIPGLLVKESFLSSAAGTGVLKAARGQTLIFYIVRCPLIFINFFTPRSKQESGVSRATISVIVLSLTHAIC